MEANLTLWGTFQDPHVEEQYQRESFEVKKGLFLYVLLWPGIFIVTLMIRTDWLLFGHNSKIFWTFMSARAIFLLVSLVSLVLTLRGPSKYLFCAAYLWLPNTLLFMLFMLFMRPLGQPNHIIIQSLSLLFLVTCLPIPAPHRALFLGLYTFLSIFILSMRWEQINEALWNVYGFAYLFSFVLGFLFARQQDRLKRTNYHHLLHERLLKQELEQAISQVQTLRDLIPLCASCKSVRDDDGYWQQVEEYLSRYTKTSFTHGICPACAERLYPDLYQKQDEEKAQQVLLPPKTET
ncbi:MAG: hypothetical protein H6728_04345 [Myxococcales bacterium]|nr:hypothetical protein [Myxococcales bacterium]MCB9642282.1 hypothetical protein [Myxococcales bacterium]